MNREILKKLAIILMISMGVVSCSKDKGDDGGTDGKERWAEVGNFKYEFNKSCVTGNCKPQDSCTTEKQKFDRKKDYCLALPNRNLNNDCALSERKALYESSCGNDFLEYNLSSKWIMGLDPRLNIVCEVGAVTQTFPTKEEYCSYLKDERQHSGCHWDTRKEEFNYTHCQGPFSAPPGQEDHPSVPDLKKYEVVRHLEAAGIKIQVSDTGLVDSAKPALEDRLKLFFENLTQIQEQLIARKAFIPRIILSQSTHYFSGRGVTGEILPDALALNIDWLYSDLAFTMRLFDRHLALEQISNILIDIGIENPAFSNELVSFLERNVLSLRNFQPTIKQIKFDGQTSALILSRRQLQLSPRSYRADFDKLSQYVVELASFFSTMDLLNVVLNIDLGNPEKSEALRPLSILMIDNFLPLQEVVLNLDIKEIRISSFFDVSRISQKERRLYFGTSPDCLRDYAEVVQTLQMFASAKRYLPHLDLELVQADLAYPFLTSMQRVNRYMSTISSKAEFLTQIRIGDIRSSYESGVLSVGFADNEEQFKKILERIH